MKIKDSTDNKNVHLKDTLLTSTAEGIYVLILLHIKLARNVKGSYFEVCTPLIHDIYSDVNVGADRWKWYNCSNG